MIFDRLENIRLYKGISETLDRAIELILTTDFTKAEEGRTEVCDGVYFTKASIETSDITSSFFEVHKKYADIFLPLSGREVVKIASPDGREVLAEYNEENDFYGVAGSLSDNGGSGLSELSLINTPETFCVCFPEEAHNSAGSVKGETIVFDKIVVKVRMFPNS